ncbi:MAG: 4Fe-4S dicluster domain-containing protein, partial [Candidatus Cloacimonetes bacterium]|nr:4Fe-4S dicluster domain-containing protein [Candidatus Cloacimonadota bacterium]
PTCHCFLLIDRENFEKVKNWDTCQYPAFGRVAAGEDPLHKLFKRLRNRYLCKFVHKPAMFGELACTGCGRCIDACIAGINKNEVLIDVCSSRKGISS